MNYTVKAVKTMLTVIAGLLLFVNFASAQGDGETFIEEWVTLGPLKLNATLFCQEDEIENWLNEDFIALPDILPEEGEIINWYPGMETAWKLVSNGQLNSLQIEMYPAVAYLSCCITTSRRQTVSIRVETPHPAALYIDGENQAQISQTGSDEAPNLLKADCDLHTGKHVIIVKIVDMGGFAPNGVNVMGFVSPQEGFSPETIIISTNPVKTFTEYGDYAVFERISGLTLSPDGDMMALSRYKRDLETFKGHWWIEIYSTSKGELLRQIEFGKSLSGQRFSKDGKSLYFRSSESGGTVLWKYSLDTGKMEQVLGPIKGLVKLLISPDEEFAVYTIDGERELPGNEDYKLLTALEQRMTDWKDERQIYIASLNDGAVHKLNDTGDFAVDEFALSPCGKKLVFTRRTTMVGRPYFRTEFWMLDLETGMNQMLKSLLIPFETRPLNLTFIPGTDYLAFVSASHFTGEDEEEKVHNLSETDLWLMDLNTLELTNLTGDTPFTVDEHGGTHGSLMWNAKDKRLYFPVMVRGFNKLYSIDLANPSDIREVPIPYDYIKCIDISADGRSVVFTAQELDKPEIAYYYDLKKGKERMILNPNSDMLEDYTLGKYERCDFTDSQGYLIDGWVFYPPDFDSAKKYPLIVYYYAGVWMLDESFYYTYHFWAANGYVVYAMSPLGSMAHGDEFSDFHVNDWGEFATQDIIEGVEKLIADKDFIDAERMGCYGGSYGGFTTLDLVTKTDIFACAVAMYGISNIASYWGGGIWGYTYGDIALAKSYPWNREDVFVNKSPLYNADKITTPLLLLHGEKDVNVPSLESEQMFTALQVQGKEAAYVRFPAEGHGIAGDFKNYIAHREMMLEWFDKYLKGEGEGWDRRWE